MIHEILQPIEMIYPDPDWVEVMQMAERKLK